MTPKHDELMKLAATNVRKLLMSKFIKGPQFTVGEELLDEMIAAEFSATVTELLRESQAEINSVNKELVKAEELATGRLKMQTVHYGLQQDFYRMAEESRIKCQAAEAGLEESRRSLVEMQKHRDAWRGYAYGHWGRPDDFIDEPRNPVGRRVPTRIEELQQQLKSAAEAALTTPKGE
jgi:hypothetical protein